MLVAAPAGTAVADPKGETFELMCANGKTYTVVTPPGNGDWTPAHDVNSNTVLVPVAFGEFTGTISQGGKEIVTFTEEGETKGSGKQRNTTSCSYAFTESFTLTADEAEAEGLPGAGTYDFEGGGTVLVQIKGGRSR